MQFLILICLLHATIMAVSGSGGNHTDHQALLAFKARITQDPLQVMSSWNDSTHFCRWQGVTCSPRHLRVTALDLSSQSLGGSIPPHLGNLSFLRVLDLHKNNFIHQIPQQLGKLSRLKQLVLENNSFNGPIPINVSRCSNLVYLGLGGNNLSGEIPAEIGSLHNLRVLWLYRNYLSGSLPPSLGNLSSLTNFSVTLNYLEGTIPNTIGQLRNLLFLSLGANQLSGTIPSSIFNLSSITLFSLPVNQIHGTLPPNLGLNTFPELVKLNIHTNHFTGQIPPSLANASHLSNIQMHNNKFTGLIPSFAKLHHLSILTLYRNNLGNGQDHNLDFLSSLSNCSTLEVLSAMDNNFGGVLPKILGNFSNKLRILGLGTNQIHGSIPSEIGNLVSLTVLGLEENRLTGIIPSSIGKLQKLSQLYLSTNNLSGTIPSSLGNLSSLVLLDLMANHLEGGIPPSLAKCPDIVLFILSSNNLNGTIPKEIVSMSSLALILDLSRNQLSGPLPFEVGSLIRLTSLDLSHNKLSGIIPSSLGSCTSLTSLHMNHNFFQGAIPKSLSSLSGLDHLDLSTNNLSGPIPKYLMNFTLLQTLNLSYNDLEGEVPADGVFKNTTASSVSGNKRLCGGIPQLQLPTCIVHKPKKQKTTLEVAIVVPFVGGCMGLILLAFVLSKKKRVLVASASLLDDLFLRLSYGDLQKATNGFSPANLIGQGSFSSVYKGILEDSETVVAVKVFNPRARGASKSFTAECQTLKSAKHRNLLKILTACSSVDFQHNEFMALVYEYMPNGCLEDWLHPNVEEQKCLSLRRRLDIAIDIACAINYLHHGNQTPIVHCDLKPSNVLLDNEMTTHVGDFGLARFLLEENQSSTIGLKGTIGYVAPEYGMGCEASTSGDVYSYGILLLEMFTGKRPTHDMFKDGLSLHEFVASALPDEVTTIVDPKLLLPVDGQDLNINNNLDETRIASDKIRECLVSILTIGIASSGESPGQRMSIDIVLTQLHQIRTSLLPTIKIYL